MDVDVHEGEEGVHSGCILVVLLELFEVKRRGHVVCVGEEEAAEEEAAEDKVQESVCLPWLSRRVVVCPRSAST